GYQTMFAERIRRETGIMTGAVGMITSPVQAEHIIRTEQADAVIMAREFLRDPYWPLRAARELDQPIAWPVQYLRAAPKGAQPRVSVNVRAVVVEEIALNVGLASLIEKVEFIGPEIRVIAFHVGIVSDMARPRRL